VEELLLANIFSDEDMFALQCVEIHASHRVQFDEFCVLVFHKFAKETPPSDDLLQMSDRLGREHSYIKKFKTRMRCTFNARLVSSGGRLDLILPAIAAW